MPKIIAKEDSLNSENARFEQKPLREPVFLNSVPKSGTHLIRNIFRMFVPVPQQYHAAFIQIPILSQHIQALDPANPMLSWGHLLFSDDSAIATRKTNHLLMVRDPYDWVLARARFFLSDNFQGNLEHLKNGNVPMEDMLNMMIFGIYQKVPTMAEIYMHNGVSWMGTGTRIVRYEDLVGHVKNIDSAQAKAFFTDLFAFAKIDLPEDWRERVLVGADRKQSGTARENLAQRHTNIPEELPQAQKELVDYACPGLRKVLGYEID